ncbi:ankyrin repeat domain-containing protein 50-like [Lineus longissimus]|uniref:ankyrin repeat domain-containing protein 50-like n=1 Tax=Lineus longissimus TaxID=88925 RepID=UPI00315CB505
MDDNGSSDLFIIRFIVAGLVLVLVLRLYLNRYLILYTASRRGYHIFVEILYICGLSIEVKFGYGQSPLWTASWNGHESVVKLLLDRGAQIESKSVNGLSSLWAASYNGHESVVRLLLDRGALIESKSDKGSSPLWIASQNGHESVVKLLLDRGALIESKSDKGRSPLWTASYNGHESVVRLLLDRGALIESKSDKVSSPLWIASQNGHESVVKLLLDRGALIESKSDNGRSPLWTASCNGHESVVKLLLDRGALIESKSDKGTSPLWIASQNGHESVVKLLLDRGALIESKSDKGTSPLWIASYNGHESVVRLLLDRGALIESKSDEGSSPLWIASENGHGSVVKLLLERGEMTEASVLSSHSPLHTTIDCENSMETLHQQKADIESKDNNKGKSPLNQAATVGQTEIVQILLEHGADIASKDNDGFSSRDNCVIHGQINVIEYFLKNITDEADLKKTIERWLLLAVRYGQKEVVIFLEKMNKTPGLDFVGHNGQSPLATAISHSHFECVRMLHSLGATLSFLSNVELAQCLSQSGSIDIYKYLLITGLNQHAEDLRDHHNLSFSEDINWDIFRMALSPHEVEERKRISTSSLIKFPGLGSVQSLNQDKLNELNVTIDTKIRAILQHNQWIVTLTGGSAELTKVGFPDEFDFTVKLTSDIHITDITDVCHGYRRCDINNHELNSSKLVHSLLWSYIDSSDDMIVSTPSAVAGGGSASTVIQLRWKEDEQRSLVVSIDLVPVLPVNDWPDDAIQKTWMMGYDDLKKQGYQLVVRPPHKDSSFGKTFKEAEREKLYRVTFSQLEVAHIKDLQPRVKNAYILAKCLRDPVVCQVVVKDDGMLHFVDKFLTSYLLKTVFMHNVKDFLDHERPLVEMAYILYSQLEYYLSRGSIPIFWMPKVNLLQGVNINAAKSHKVAAHMKAFVGGLYKEELNQEPPRNVNANLGKPPCRLDLDPNDATALEILSLPLKPGQ